MDRLEPNEKLAPAEDQTLVESLRAGDEVAFEQLVRSQGGRMLSVARRYLAMEEDARDAVQDAFLSAFKALPTFDGRASLSTWLHRVVVNSCLMKIRTRQRQPECSIEDLLPTFLSDGHQTAPSPTWADTAIELERAETRQIVRDQIAKLPESYRTVLLLRDIEELDTEAVAQLLDLSANAVKVRLHRARQALRTLLDPLLGGPPPC
ncbi:MAG: sigma-70 family RNA polymerase sigma factor [Planctomycetaceae bacterium]